MRVSGRLSLVLCLVLCVSLLFAVSASAQPSDVQGHWAENQVTEWVENGLAAGYQDGTFKPNNQITRAEFVALVNRAFEKQDPDATADFSDVAPSNWFYAEVAAASAAGYVGGYQDGTFQPQNAISRQEAASMIARLLGLSSDAAEASFTDADAIGAWAKGAVNAVAEGEIMGGYPDGSFGPARSITRAEAVVTLDRALGWGDALPTEYTEYDEAGTYGPESGVRTINDTVVVKAADVVLQNLVIKEDLIIAEEVGDGDVTLNNVKVEGKTYVRGGGADSIHINGGEYGDIIVEKTVTGTLRIVAMDAVGVNVFVAESAANDVVILEGAFQSVTVQADGVKVSTEEGTTIEEFKIESDLKDVEVELAKDSIVTKMVLDSEADVTGEGTVEETSGDAVEDAIGGGGGGYTGGGAKKTDEEKAKDAFYDKASDYDELKADGEKVAEVEFDTADNKIVITIDEAKKGEDIQILRNTRLFSEIMPALGVKKVKINSQERDVTDPALYGEVYLSIFDDLELPKTLGDLVGRSFSFTAKIQPDGHVQFEQDFTLEFKVEA